MNGLCDKSLAIIQYQLITLSSTRHSPAPGIVRDGMPVVDISGNAVILSECRCGVFVGLVALVQDHLDLNAATMCFRESLGNRRGRE